MCDSAKGYCINPSLVTLTRKATDIWIPAKASFTQSMSDGLARCWNISIIPTMATQGKANGVYNGKEGNWQEIHPRCFATLLPPLDWESTEVCLVLHCFTVWIGTDGSAILDWRKQERLGWWDIHTHPVPGSRADDKVNCLFCFWRAFSEQPHGGFWPQAQPTSEWIISPLLSERKSLYSWEYLFHLQAFCDPVIVYIVRGKVALGLFCWCLGPKSDSLVRPFWYVGQARICFLTYLTLTFPPGVLHVDPDKYLPLKAWYSLS